MASDEALPSVDSVETRDPLTGALTREHLRKLLEDALEMPEHHTALLLIAVTDLATVIEKHGESARDAVMQQLGYTLLTFENDSIHVAYIDPAAFAVVVRGYPPAQVSSLAADMRLKFANQQLRAPDTLQIIGDVSVSVGIASRLPCEPRERLMRRADAALEKAIKSGKQAAA